jgi:hypothetical protein
MSQSSPLAKEIAHYILEHLSWQDLIELAVEQMPLQTNDSVIMNKVRQAKYKKIAKVITPICITNLDPRQSYIIHIDGKYRHIKYKYKSGCFIGDNVQVICDMNKHSRILQSIYTGRLGRSSRKRDPSEYQIYPYNSL